VWQATKISPELHKYREQRRPDGSVREPVTVPRHRTLEPHPCAQPIMGSSSWHDEALGGARGAMPVPPSS